MIQGWMGSLGRLQPVWSTPSMSITPTLEKTYTTTLGGRQYVRQGPRGHREWALSGYGGTGEDLAPVVLMASGAWGVGPWWWLSPWAVGANALTPDGSRLAWADLAGATVAGPVQVEGGLWLPQSAIASGASTNAIARSETAGYLPVPAGTPYTGSLFVSAAQSVRVSEFGADLGVTVRAVTSAPAPAGAGLRRVTVSSVASASTAALRLDVLGAGQVAGAALTLTSTVAPWALGDGCEQAVVDSESRDVEVMSRDPWSNQSFTIKEVG